MCYYWCTYLRLLFPISTHCLPFPVSVLWIFWPTAENGFWHFGSCGRSALRKTTVVVTFLRTNWTIHIGHVRRPLVCIVSKNFDLEILHRIHRAEHGQVKSGSFYEPRESLRLKMTHNPNRPALGCCQEARSFATDRCTRFHHRPMAHDAPTRFAARVFHVLMLSQRGSTGCCLCCSHGFGRMHVLATRSAPLYVSVERKVVCT